MLPLDTLLQLNGVIRYAIWQLDCTRTNVVHGYVQFHSPQTMVYIKCLIPCSKWTKACGSSDVNKDSCSKPDSRFFEIGVPVVRGQRNDLRSLEVANVVLQNEIDNPVLEEDLNNPFTDDALVEMMLCSGFPALPEMDERFNNLFF